MKINISDIPKGKSHKDYPKGTIFVFKEHFPRYILDPFERVFPDDPRYKTALTGEQLEKLIDDLD
ncbi:MULTISPECIES: hypothetical protein [Ruminococcus]|jgi:hypothetical protein|uniref:hypothetical protein n=1 Tax=Ruminococcus sp. TaxID=41978 RepID=UPI0025F70C9D|nr:MULTISPECIES: hypothetical protein [Ruminococcus]